MYKQDVQKLKLFGATLGIDDDEQTKTRKGISDLKFIIIKVLEGKTDEEKCNTFKHMLEDLNFYNEDHESAQADQKKDEKKMVVMMTTMLIVMIKVIFFHPSYVS